jgi:hypothetical protein
MYIGIVIILLYIIAVMLQVWIYNGPLATSSFPVRKSNLAVSPSLALSQPAISLLYFQLARRTKARAEGSEASGSLPVPCSAWPYSAAEDKALRKLVVRGWRGRKLRSSACSLLRGLCGGCRCVGQGTWVLQLRQRNARNAKGLLGSKARMSNFYTRMTSQPREWGSL